MLSGLALAVEAKFYCTMITPFLEKLKYLFRIPESLFFVKVF
jgi:hypothetical protein